MAASQDTGQRQGARGMTSSEGPGAGDWAAPGSSTPPPGWASPQPPPAGPPTTPAWGESTQGWATTGAATSAWGPPYAPPPPPRPGIIPLRPLGVGEILDGAFTLLRRYPRATLGLAALVMLVVEVVRVVSDSFLLVGVSAPPTGTSFSDAADYFARAGTAALVSFAVTGLALLVLTGAITAVVGQAVLGRSMSAGEAWRSLRPLFGRLVGVSMLTWLIILGIVTVALAPGIALAAGGSGGGGAALLVLGGIAGAVAAAYFAVALSLAPAVLVLEKQTVRGALRRSRALVRGSWWRVLGILLLAGIISTVVSGIVSLPFGIAGGGVVGFTSAHTLSFGELIASGVGAMVAGTIVRPFSAGVAALLYIDRRMRAEALDLALVQATSTQRPTA